MYYKIMHVIIIIHKIYSVKVGLNTKLTQSGSNIFLTLFMIPTFLKFCIQLTINQMEGHVFSYFYLHKFLIYFHVFISKILSFLNYILGGLLFFGLLDHAYTLKNILHLTYLKWWFTNPRKMLHCTIMYN